MNKKTLFRLSSVLLFGLLFGLVLMGCSANSDVAVEEGTGGAAADPALHNIEWQWVELSGTAVNPAKTIPNPENYTITFRPDGTYNGKADCNVINGTYSQESGGFKINPGPSTQAACGSDSLDQEYLRLLSSVAAGGPDGAGGLALETAGGAERMTFKNGGAASE